MLLFGFAVPRTAAGQAKDVQAILVKATGDVKRRTPEGAWEKAESKKALSPEDRLLTGQRSEAEIRYADGTKLVWRSNTDARISEKRGVYLDQGHIALDVKQQKSDPFDLGSRNSVGKIKGTTGAWVVDADGTSKLYILSGVATLISNTTGDSLEVKQGHVGTVNAQGKLNVDRITTLDQKDIMLDFFTPSVHAGLRTGLTLYGGDRDLNPSNDVSRFLKSVSFGFGLEGGYQFSQHWGTGMMFFTGHYPRISTPIVAPTYPPIDPKTTSDWRNHINVFTRYTVFTQKRLTPYVQTGLNVSFGTINDKTRTAFGPVIGVGLEGTMPGGITLFVEYVNMVLLDDNAIDLADPGGPADVTDTDAITFYSFGLRKKMKLFSPRLR